jgi:hypothetical protein
MTLPDPDQDLLNKLDRRERRLEVLSLAPAFGWALAADLTDILYHRDRETIASLPPDPEVAGLG